MKQKTFKVEVKNPLGLDKEHLSAIHKYFSHVAPVDPEFAQKIVLYLVDDTNEDILSKVPVTPEFLGPLGFDDANGDVDYELISNMEKFRAAVLGGNWNAAPEFWMRVGNFLMAIHVAAGNQITQASGRPDWLTTLMEELESLRYDMEDNQVWSTEQVEKLLVASELSADLLVEDMLAPYSRVPFTRSEQYLNRHCSTVERVLSAAPTDGKIAILTTLRKHKFDFKPLISSITPMAYSSSKTLREAVLTALMSSQDILPLAVPLLEDALVQGNAAERNEAVLALWRLQGLNCADTLKAHAAKEKADRVKQTISKLLAVPEEGSAVNLQLEPLTIETGVVKLDKKTQDHINDHIHKAHKELVDDFESELKRWNSPDRPQWMDKPEKPAPLKESTISELLEFMEGTRTTVDSKALEAVDPKCPTEEWWAPPAVQLVHLVRFAYATGALTVSADDELWWRADESIEAFRSRALPRFGLRELDAAVATLPGFKPGLVAKWYLENDPRWSSCEWEPDDVWPVFVDEMQQLTQALAPAQRDSYTAGLTRVNALNILAMFPQVPAKCMHLLWDLALGELKADRLQAQKALASVEGKTKKVAVALEDGKQNIRQAAAEWLGKLGDKGAIEALKKAFAKEKSEVVKGTMLVALDALNADMDEFLNRKTLLQEAKAGLSKKLPKGMEWVPLEKLPTLHWEDTGEAVDPSLVKWWVVQSIQQKNSVCGPILRKLLSTCRKNETAALARMLCSTFIAYDTETISHEAASARAQEETDDEWDSTDSFYVEYYGTKEKLYQQNLSRIAGELLHSANDQKGMLAIVSATGDKECAKMCEQYIRKWFGNRLAQCKCMIDILDGIEDPLALQILLSIANRFRTKALKQAAEERVLAIAERQGWTLDELADRTIPDAGFERPQDENGEPIGTRAVLELDYGPRQFNVELNDNLEPIITVKGENKPLKSPPAPGKNDDEEKAAEAKKTFNDAKKVVKDVVKRQRERLYEALCTQRSWTLHDWKTYLAHHPIVGRLCVQIAWAAFKPGSDGGDEFLTCFRPLEDNSLTNEADEEVQLDEDTIVRVAHSCHVSDKSGEAWLKHFEDYDVEPLFKQFGRTSYVLREEQTADTDIDQFRGHMINTFKLRGKATKLGYTRGDVEDGGCFYSYHKTFGSLGLQANIEFTGSYVPEEDVAAALTVLNFTYIPTAEQQRRYRHPGKAQLGKIPPVLLSECISDLDLIAKEGSGFDEKWQEKSWM